MQYWRYYLIESVVVLGKVEDVKQFDGLVQLFVVVYVEHLTARQKSLVVVRVDELFHRVRVLEKQ